MEGNMKLLSRTEEIVLAAVWKLGDDAYGIAISDYINQSTGLNWKFGAIYSPLARLVEGGYLITYEGDPTPERGGRRKVFYRLTEKGVKALREVQRIQTAVWQDMPTLELE